MNVQMIGGCPVCGDPAPHSHTAEEIMRSTQIPAQKPEEGAAQPAQGDAQ
jgi:hypothetical protein